MGTPAFVVLEVTPLLLLCFAGAQRHGVSRFRLLLLLCLRCDLSQALPSIADVLMALPNVH
eukprot:3377073-Karenia_brevis.AAC.1